MSNITNGPVLVVEDEPVVRLVACDSLEHAGFEVLEAKDSEQAIQILNARDDVAVLFTDVNMPGSLSGLELAEYVHARWPLIKLVVTSGRAPDRSVPDDGRFLTKPYSQERMTQMISDLTKRNAE